MSKKKSFTILHTNDMHSAFIGMAPASDYTPFTLNDDKTRGGFARLAGIPRNTKGKLAFAPKNKAGQPLTSKVEALEGPHENSGYLLAPPGTVDKHSAVMAGDGAAREIKEWQAIMDHLRNFPVKNKGELPTIPTDERTREVRAIKVG